MKRVDILPYYHGHVRKYTKVQQKIVSFYYINPPEDFCDCNYYSKVVLVSYGTI